MQPRCIGFDIGCMKNHFVFAREIAELVLEIGLSISTGESGRNTTVFLFPLSDEIKLIVYSKNHLV